MKLSILYDPFFMQLSDEKLASITDNVPGVVIEYCGGGSCAQIDDIVDSEVIFGKPPPKMVAKLKSLKWLHLPSAGADPFSDASLYADPSVILTKSSGTFGIPIAEHIIGMMIALGHNFTRHYTDQQVGAWRQDWLGNLNIYGSNVLVLGLGDIGTEVCKRLSGFSCNIIGFRNDPSVPHELVSEVRHISRLKESIPDADYILICLPGTDDTKKLFRRDEFDLMKKTAIIVNIGRGHIIDTDALIDALNTHKIAGAGLDVTDPEPLPAGHPLWSAKNVLITPHVSAFSPMILERRFDIFLDLLKLYASGKPMYNIVDLTLGY